MKSIILSFVWILVTISCFAADEKIDPAWIAEIKDAPIFYDVPGMTGIRLEKNIVYEPQDKMALDLYLPSGRKGKAPVVILIHGGPLPPNLKTTPKEWAVYKSYGRLLAHSGFAAVAFDHRFFGYDKLDKAQGDIDHLIEFIRTGAGKWQLDPDKIILWGFSAGAPFLCKYVKDPPPSILAIISYYGILDLLALRNEIPENIPDEQLLSYSPARSIASSKAAIPMLIVRGGSDDPRLVNGTDLFIKNAIENKIHVTVINFPEGHHAFDVQDKLPMTRQIIRQTIDFLKMIAE